MFGFQGDIFGYHGDMFGFQGDMFGYQGDMFGYHGDIIYDSYHGYMTYIVTWEILVCDDRGCDVGSCYGVTQPWRSGC